MMYIIIMRNITESIAKRLALRAAQRYNDLTGTGDQYKYATLCMFALSHVETQASGRWHAAKNWLFRANEKWMEKTVKQTYKSITGQTWKKYADSSDLSNIEE